MGRKRKYITEKQQTDARRKRQIKYYEKHKDEILEKLREKYKIEKDIKHGTEPNEKSI